jgi:hypothetical protein
MSYLEIYNDVVRDLLVVGGGAKDKDKGAKEKKLEVSGRRLRLMGADGS